MGQTVPIRYSSWAHKCTQHQILYIWLALFTPLFCIFLHLFLPKSSGYPFPHLWFHSKNSHNKSCALPKCSSSASHNMSHTPRQAPASVLKVLWHWLTGFIPGHGAEDLLGLPSEVPKQGVPFTESLSQGPSCHCAPVLLWTCEDELVMGWWLMWWVWE